MAEASQEPQQTSPQTQELPRELKFRNSGTDWALRFVIFIVFLYFGTAKFKGVAGTPWVALFDQIGFGQWFRYFTGVLEIAGGFLVLVSNAVEIGLAILIAVMFGALVISLLLLHSPSEAFFPFAFLCAVVAFWLHRRRV
jgi:putative oxidoreductase